MYAVIGFLGALGSRCAFLLMPIRLDPRDLVFLPGTSKENSGKALENSRTCEEIIAHSLHFSEELRASLENRVNLKNPQELIMRISWEFPRKPYLWVAWFGHTLLLVSCDYWKFFWFYSKIYYLSLNRAKTPLKSSFLCMLIIKLSQKLAFNQNFP